LSALVSSFDRVRIGDLEYLFFLVFWNELQTPLTEQLERQIEQFGSSIGEKGMIVKGYKRASYETAEEVLKKDWPEDVRSRLEREQDPYMLLISTDFKTFSPMEDPWSIIWFSEYWDEPDRVYRIFGQLARKVRSGEDIFSVLSSEAKRKRYKKWAKYFQLKPGIYGCCIDAKAIFEDLAGVKD
jgi:hypothetical protein